MNNWVRIISGFYFGIIIGGLIGSIGKVMPAYTTTESDVWFAAGFMSLFFFLGYLSKK